MSNQPTASELVRQYTIAGNTQRGLIDDSSVDSVLQDLLVNDRDIKQVLKGDMLEPLNQVYTYLDLFDKAKMLTDKPVLAHEQVEDIKSIFETLNATMVRFKRLLPYLILNSPLMRLTNNSQKEVYQNKLRISLMIGRDLLDINEDELEMTDVNFFDSIEMMSHNAAQDSLNGNKIKALVEQRKLVRTEIEETRPKGKGILGRFHV